jgi:putative transcriptional regulator
MPSHDGVSFVSPHLANVGIWHLRHSGPMPHTGRKYLKYAKNLECQVTANTIKFSGNLAGKLLIAMPGMGDLRFDQSVVFMCAHSEDGAMGLIINKPAQDVVLGDVLGQLDIDVSQQVRESRVYIGGPVETARGFVLHSREYQSNLQTLNVDADFGMTCTLDILEEIGKATGPAQSQLMLGYAGWGAGQLEAEIRQNGWLVCEASFELVFGTDDDTKWSKALDSIGVNPLTLSSAGGRA